LFVLAGALPASRISAEQAAPASKIVSVAFIGNTVTRESTLRLFMQSLDLDTGSLYDSAKADYAKKKLRATNLFSKVDILTIFKDDGVHLTLAVRENFYLIPEGVGGGYYTRKYGRSDLWYRLQLGFTKYNFRGRMETFSVESSLWDYRALGLSWTKPLYPSPYYIALSAAGVYGPELNLPQNRFSVSGKIAVGRKLSIHSRGFVGVIPMQTRVDGLDGSAIKRYRELVSFAGAAADFRGDSYEPRGGWLAYGDFKSNALYSDSTPKYGQFTTELRWYRSGFFTRDRFALRLQSALRTNDAGGFKRIYIGGESTVRGFPSGWLGQPDIMNNYAMISAEYRFFLFRTPVINPWPNCAASFSKPTARSSPTRATFGMTSDAPSTGAKTAGASAPESGSRRRP
jgi:outer membrane protein assembly factor BamA